VSEEDAPLLSALKAKRRALAEAARVPAYVIFTDRTLIEMAETKPQSLDEIARISGVGATKLERYGAAFLEVITGEAEAPAHPARRKLAGREAGAIYDRLLSVQADLARGDTGLDKPLSCSSSQLAKLADLRPTDRETVERLLGERRADRFADAFLDVLRKLRASWPRNPTRPGKETPMLTVISPAKRLDWSPRDLDMTEPVFQDPTPMRWPRWRAELPVAKLMKLMGISRDLAGLNAERFARFGEDRTDRRPAAFAFAGDTYAGLEAGTLDDDALRYAQDHLRILSGLYGLLRPLDAIEPYRLEMGSRLKTAKGASLYDWWGARLAEATQRRGESARHDILVNCASVEYFSAVDATRSTCMSSRRSSSRTKPEGPRSSASSPRRPGAPWRATSSRTG
jgi:cytoplasmic iron level regulating protein YaaA (DUF328/UPF0246 family)